MLKSPKAQRFIASSITALLAANAVVLVTGIIGGDKKDAPAVSTEAKTITYIQNADGTQTLVDPTTPEGWQAINDAEQRGDQVVTVPTDEAPAAVQAQRVTTTTRPGTKPVATNGAGSGVTIPTVTIPDINGVLNTVTSTVNSVVGTVNDTLTTVTSILEETTDVTVPHVTVPTVPTVTVPPVTTPPVTAPPVTAPPVTAPPVTAPPVTAPPVTVPPVTAPTVTVPVLP